MPTFASFKKTLDGEMKSLKAHGAGIHIKRAQPFDMQEEEQTLGERDFRQSFTTNSTRHCVAYILSFVVVKSIAVDNSVK